MSDHPSTSLPAIPHGLPAQRRSRSVRPLLVLLGGAMLADAASWLMATGPTSREVLVPLVLGAGLLVLARLTHSRVPGIGWGIGCLAAILMVAGAGPELRAVLAGDWRLHLLARVLVAAIGVLYLLASALALWFWISRRPPKPSALTPIGWR